VHFPWWLSFASLSTLFCACYWLWLLWFSISKTPNKRSSTVTRRSATLFVSIKLLCLCLVPAMSTEHLSTLRKFIITLTSLSDINLQPSSSGIEMACWRWTWTSLMMFRSRMATTRQNHWRERQLASIETNHLLLWLHDSWISQTSFVASQSSQLRVRAPYTQSHDTRA